MNETKEAISTGGRVEEAIISMMKAKAILIALDDAFSGSWKKLGVKGEYISSLLGVLLDEVELTTEHLDRIIEDI